MKKKTDPQTVTMTATFTDGDIKKLVDVLFCNCPDCMTEREYESKRHEDEIAFGA